MRLQVLVPAPRWDLPRFSRASTKTVLLNGHPLRVQSWSRVEALSWDLLLSWLDLHRLTTIVPLVSFFFP